MLTLAVLTIVVSCGSIVAVAVGHLMHEHQPDRYNFTTINLEDLE